jgi:hypothetical protein
VRDLQLLDWLSASDRIVVDYERIVVDKPDPGGTSANQH